MWLESFEDSKGPCKLRRRRICTEWSEEVFKSSFGRRRHALISSFYLKIRIGLFNICVKSMQNAGPSCQTSRFAGDDTRARASVNKRPYMRILENTRSSIRSGRGNCGKRKTLWYVMIFQNQRQKIFVAKVGILCGYFRDKSLLSDQNSRKAGFWLSQGHESCRCGIFRGGFRWKSHESCPQGFVEDFGRIFL